jgi:alpha-methylacyl-CoA racemase
MVDGASVAAGLFHGMMASVRAVGTRKQRAANLLDGGAPFYDTYEAADGPV